MSKHFASHHRRQIAVYIIACCVLIEHTTWLYFPLVKQLGQNCLDPTQGLGFIGDVLKAVWALQLGTDSEHFKTHSFLQASGCFDVASSAGNCFGQMKWEELKVH